jgi:hypothetical protein
MADALALASLEIEGIMRMFPELVKSGYALESRFKSTRATQVGTKAFRLPMKYSRPEDYSALDLNGGTLSMGDFSKWNNGSITPYVGAVSTNWTKLVELAGVNKDNVAIVNVVDENMKDLAKQIRNWRNKLLHTNGKGWIATVASVNPATQTYTLQSGPNTSGGSFGARLLGPGLTIDVVNSATDLRRGSLTVNYKFDLLGQTQTFNYIGQDPGGVNGDYIRVRGLVDGAPIGMYGLPYFINNSTAGTLLGIVKASAPYVVSNSIDCGGGQLTQPMVEALVNMIQQRLEDDPMAGGFFHWHRSQKQSYSELGFNLMTIPMANGTAPSELDLFFGGKGGGDTYKLMGFSTHMDDHADNTAIYFIQPDGWGRVGYGDGGEPFWYENPSGGKIYQIYDPATGLPKTQYGATMIDPTQFYCDNAMAQGVLTDLGLPAFN